MLEKAGVLAQIALRNLLASWINVIIGLLILGGTFLFVVLGSALDSLNESMQRSIVRSMSGDLQIYSASSKEQPSLIGGMMGVEAKVDVLEDFSKVEQVVARVPNVRAVVPMGYSDAMVSSGNVIDFMLEKLRAAVNRAQAPGATEADRARAQSLKEHVRHIVRILEKDRARAEVMIEKTADDLKADEAITRASSDAFWAEFEADPLGGLEFLENRIAPQLSDGDMLFIRYTGTDLDKFRRAFDTMEIVDGEMVPTGRRGLMLPKFWYEENFKLKTARRLDKIKEAIEEGKKRIADDADLKRYVRENVSQTRDILFQLDPLATREVTARLQRSLGSQEADLEKLLVQLLDTDDANFQERYRIFYADVAPMLELYRLRIGDTISIKALSGSGYLEAVNLKLYGTFRFKGLEKSPMAGFTSLTDIQSFRELYGYLNPARRAELQRIKEEAGARDVSREEAEAALFGDATAIEGEGTSADLDAAEQLGELDRTRGLDEAVYSQKDIDEGIAISAAVMLEDSSRAERTREAIEEASAAAGLPVKTASWQQATGVFGEFVQYVRYALFLIVGIIFLVAMVILSNAVLMATLRRIREIGTMRAIGAQRGFVRAMIVVETVVLGTVFGGVGLLLGSGLVAVLGSVGIPAFTEELYFFFAGPRWFPDVYGRQVVIAYALVLLVSIASTLYPALIATRVAPIDAMASED